MLHLIVYDIADDKRLRRVAKICEDYGIRVEKSVFECDLPDVQFSEMWSMLAEVILRDEDKVIDYPVGLSERRKIRALGMGSHQEPQLTIVF